MKKIKTLNFIIILVFTSSHQLFSQFSGSNLANFQIGNQPGIKPANQSNLYNQLNFRYNQENFTLGIRSEIYKINTPDEYSNISQKYIRYRSDNLQVQVGNFHEILGKGLLLRSFEIPGSIYEVFGQRYGFYKDIDGLSIRYQNDYLNTKFLYGRPLDRSLPPAFGEKVRRPSLVHGGEINLILFENITPGVTYLKSEQAKEVSGQSNSSEYFGLNLEGLVSDNIQYYAEYATDTKPNNGQDFLDNSQAFYASANVGLDWINITGEYKYYNDFLLIFNDPPPLTKEHSFSLLNRSTHVINLTNENGYQLEMLFNIGDFNTITLNHARAENDNTKKIFEEYYIDFNYYLTEQILIKTFADFSEDEPEFQFNRYTAGVLLENPIIDLFTMSTELQYQQYEHDLPTSPFFGNLDQNVKNVLFSLFVSHSSEFSVGASVELSNDREETDPNLTGKPEEFISWPSLNASYQYNQQNTFSLFYGKRRGGNACTGGVCYQVLPFEGLELRLNSRF